jgi:hypothetical protein
VSLPPTPVDFVQSIHFMVVKSGLRGPKIDFVGKVLILGWLAYQGTHFVFGAWEMECGRALLDAHLSDDRAVAKMGYPVLWWF